MRKLEDGLQVIENIGTANVFCLGTPQEDVLIDAGIFMKTKYLIEELADSKYKLENLKTIILTHCHCDHIGGVRELLASSNAKVAAHRDDVPYILQKSVIAGPYHGMMIEEQKAMKQLDCIVPRVDHILDDGSSIENLEVIHVPGHTPGSIALYQRNRKYMFFGDVIRENRKTGLSIGKPEKFNVDSRQVKADAQKLLAYEIDYGLLSHGKAYAGQEVETLRALIRTV